MALDSIKRISIREYLEARGIKPRREHGNRAMYLSPFRQEGNASFSVNFDENVWYDHGIAEGGSIIDLVARMEKCSVAEAIRRLEVGSAGIVARAHIAWPNEPSRIGIVSVGKLSHPALTGYLCDRNIDPATARKYCAEVRYRIGDREYFAIGFRNDAGGWELRNRNFKGCSTPKNITTIRNGSDTAMVFEGFMDFLSYLSLKQNPSPTIDTTVLNSIANLRKAIPFLETHRTVHAFLDNDEAGRHAVEQLRQSLPDSEVVDQSAFYRNHKDLNDYWREQTAAKVKRQIPAQKKRSGWKL